MATPDERLRKVKMTLLVLVEVIEKVKDPEDKKKLRACLESLQHALS